MKKTRFQDGIHNYCDRWCERCNATDRCALYADLARAERRHKRRGEDPHNWDVILKDVHRSFERTLRLVRRSAGKMGLDLSELAAEAALAPARDRTPVDKHPLAQEGTAFFKSAAKLVDAVAPKINTARKDIATRSSFMDVEPEAAELVRVHHAWEVLNWDSSLVAAKLTRAISGLIELAVDASAIDEMDFHLEDAQLTAALVLRCLRRDKAALLVVYDWSEEDQDLTIELLARVERMTRALRRLLPGAIRHLAFPGTPGRARADGSNTKSRTAGL